MNTDTSVLRNFLILAETLHFTRSSDKSYIAQPALSRQIRQLEEKVGAKLFERNKRNVVLTPAGQYFKKEIETLLGQFDHVVKRASQLHNGQAGELRIGYTHSVMQSFMPSLICYLNAAFPDLRIILLEFNNVRQYKALIDRDIDVGFSTNPEINEHFRNKLILRENFAVALSADHPLDERNFKGLSDLKDENFILAPKTEGPMYVATIESMFVDAGFLPNIIHETPFAGTSIRLVETGHGVTIEPLSSLNSYSRIKSIELKDLPQKVEIFMLWLPLVEASFPAVMKLMKTFKARSDLFL